MSDVSGEMVRPYKRDSISITQSIDENGSGTLEQWSSPIFNPFPLSELKMPEGPKWIWENYIARGCMTVFCASSKCGKTTLLGHVWRAMAQGGAVIDPVSPGQVLLITEESDRDLCERRNFLKLGANMIIDQTYMSEPPTMERFQALLEDIIRYEQRFGVYDLIVFDTLTACLPITDENDAVEMTRVIVTTKKALCKVGSAVVLVHHDRKAGGSHGSSIRGSTAISGQVEFISELKWPGEDESTNDRRLTVRSRSSIDPEAKDRIISLTEDHQSYVLGAKMGCRKDLIKDLFMLEDSLTISQLIEQWPSGSIKVPTRRTLKSDLDSLVDSGVLVCSGSGSRNDPTRYSPAPRAVPGTGTPGPEGFPKGRD